VNLALDQVPRNGTVVDPVCGMLVEPAVAVGRNLRSEHDGRDFYFCGRGCKLDFDEDPERYLGPDHKPSM
jgi:YHS domain-containing protein